MRQQASSPGEQNESKTDSRNRRGLGFDRGDFLLLCRPRGARWTAASRGAQIRKLQRLRKRIQRGEGRCQSPTASFAYLSVLSAGGLCSRAFGKGISR